MEKQPLQSYSCAYKQSPSILEEEEELTQQDVDAWNALMIPIEVRMTRLQQKQQELLERKYHRERKRRHTEWKQGIRTDVESLYHMTTPN